MKVLAWEKEKKSVFREKLSYTGSFSPFSPERRGASSSS